MAEFRINQFKYSWTGPWITDNQYAKDEVVQYGPSVYVCIRTHTSDVNFYNDLNRIFEGETLPSPAWIPMLEGLSWIGEWTPNTLHNQGDIVLYGGVLYLCINSYTSNNTFDDGILNWVVYIASSAYKQDWIENNRYGIGDVVKYNGIVYRCIEGHTSASNFNGISVDQAKWEIVHENIEYRGDWAIGIKYRRNDLVKFGGTIFRCKEGHTAGNDSTLNFDQEEYWEIEFPGFQFSGEWDSTTVYQVGDIVRHGGYVYYSLTTNYNSKPADSIYQIEDRDDPIDWEIVSKAINFKGTWSIDEVYNTGDLVRRGGNLYVAILDSTTDGSTLDYIDTSNWELVVPSQATRNFWKEGQTYSINELVTFRGSLYACNEEHNSTDQNYPGDNGSGFFYWDFIVEANTPAGLQQRGDLLTYNLDRTLANDGSSFGPTNVRIGSEGELLTIDNQETVIYKEYGQINRVFYVETDGVDDFVDAQRGVSPFKPWRTIRFACLRADDGFTGTTTINVGAGVFEEVLPIVIPQRTVVLGTELRTTTITAAGPNENLATDSTYSIAVLGRISQLIEDVLLGIELVIPKSVGNELDPVVIGTSQQISFDPPQFDENSIEILQTVIVPLPIATQAVTDIRALILNIQDYINFYVNNTGILPTLTGSNVAKTNEAYLNALEVLEANTEFLVAEAIAYTQETYPSYPFDTEVCARDIRSYVAAWKKDLSFAGNYHSILAARYYRNAVLGSTGEDMFYCRDATGVRNCTLKGLEGTLIPPAGEGGPYGTPSGGAYCSLDPGWGPNDTRTWINTRSPYIQGVTTFGYGCVGQKIDGALHNGGNKSMVSNDFTQVISDGVGAWVTNNGRAELVSVFTYYAHVGYLAQNGGIIRATNGNNSYGDFGSLADNVDATEVPQSALHYTRAQQAIVAAAFAGDFVDEIQILEWKNAGQNYTQASASFVGSGVNANVLFEEFRDDAVFEARLLDTSTSITPNVGGGGYTIVQNSSQSGNLTSITIATNDPNEEADYLGMRIVLTSGPGTGQYAYITSYDTISKLITVSRESDNTPGWDHVVPGKTIEPILTTNTTYRIEPRVIFDDPGFTVNQIIVPTSTLWGDIVFGETTESFLAIEVDAGDDPNGVTVPEPAIFDIIKEGRDYTVTIVSGGSGYAVGQEFVILGTILGGLTPINDLVIEVSQISFDGEKTIVDVLLKYNGTSLPTFGASGKFVAVPATGTAALYSSDGSNWTQFNMPSAGNWKCLAAGNNRFVAIRTDSNAAASSLDAKIWTARTMPSAEKWNAVAYGDGVFLAVAAEGNAGAYSTDGETWTAVTLPTAGDSTFNEWVDIAYGRGTFVVIANSNNLVAQGTWDAETSSFSWDIHILDVIADSSQKDWVSIAYGNNRFVAMSNQGDVGYSFDGVLWKPAVMPTQDGSTLHSWKKIKYAQGVFFAIGDTAGRDIGGEPTAGPSTFAATSYDGILWTPRTLATEENWISVAFGNPYIDQEDSTVGKKTPIWVTLPRSSNRFNRVRTGARALGRVIVSAGVINEIRLWDPGSGYRSQPIVTFVDPNNTSDAKVQCRTADGVLTNPTWINRGLGYRTANTRVTITGDGFSDVLPVGKFIVINGLSAYPGPGAQLTIQGLSEIYGLVAIEQLGLTELGLAARIRVSPEIRVRDELEHLTPIEIRVRYSQCRVTGHDFLDIGTGNFEDTNYPDLYTQADFFSAPENEVVDVAGGRVFYTSTDQNGNFRTGELFAVEQATGIVTISADFFDFSGLTELRLGGIRVGGTGAVIREFSTDPLFSEDSNNIVPTQRAIRAYLQGRLSIGGSEIAVGSFIAGTILVGPSRINNTAGLTIIVPVRADFEGPKASIWGSMLAQTMFYKSF